jgi:hypothetical protein
MLLDTHRATLPVAGFTIFNECGLPPYVWSVAHVNVAPLVPGSGVNNDGFPLSKPATLETMFVLFSAASSKSS